MNPPNKKPLETKVAQPFKPAVFQSKNTVSAQSIKRPVAPPVYRPQSKPNAAQAKIADPLQIRPHPVAPPVYRPQPVPKILQRQAAVKQLPVGQAARTSMRNAAPVSARPVIHHPGAAPAKSRGSGNTVQPTIWGMISGAVMGGLAVGAAGLLASNPIGWGVYAGGALVGATLNHLRTGPDPTPPLLGNGIDHLQPGPGKYKNTLSNTLPDELTETIGKGRGPFNSVNDAVPFKQMVESGAIFKWTYDVFNKLNVIDPMYKHAVAAGGAAVKTGGQGRYNNVSGTLVLDNETGHYRTALESLEQSRGAWEGLGYRVEFKARRDLAALFAKI